MKGFLKKRLLRLIAYNEIHIFHHFSQTFRKEFAEIRSVLEGPVRCLMMTATCTRQIIHSCQRILNLTPTNVYWGGQKEQEMQNVQFCVNYRM